jgi:hypothetical protein
LGNFGVVGLVSEDSCCVNIGDVAVVWEVLGMNITDVVLSVCDVLDIADDDVVSSVLDVSVDVAFTIGGVLSSSVVGVKLGDVDSPAAEVLL